MTKPGPIVKPIKERLLANSDRSGKCWLWKLSHTPKGYGQITWQGKNWRVHRVSYIVFVGEIPEKMQLDHLCRVRHCINPKHLEVVDNRTNILRGESSAAQRARQIECIRGHPFDEENTFIEQGHRQCRKCSTFRRRRRSARKKRRINAT